MSHPRERGREMRGYVYIEKERGRKRNQVLLVVHLNSCAIQQYVHQPRSLSLWILIHLFVDENVDQMKATVSHRLFS